MAGGASRCAAWANSIRVDACANPMPLATRLTHNNRRSSSEGRLTFLLYREVERAVFNTGEFRTGVQGTNWEGIPLLCVADPAAAGGIYGCGDRAVCSGVPGGFTAALTACWSSVASTSTVRVALRRLGRCG